MSYYSGNNSTTWIDGSSYTIKYTNVNGGSWISVNTTPTYASGKPRKNASLLGLLREDHHSKKTERLKQALI